VDTILHVATLEIKMGSPDAYATRITSTTHLHRALFVNCVNKLPIEPALTSRRTRNRGAAAREQLLQM
jgi:hypothetical protein